MYSLALFNRAFAHAYIYSPCYSEKITDELLDDDLMMYLMGSDISG